MAVAGLLLMLLAACTRSSGIALEPCAGCELGVARCADGT
jgi:hypothetical protein